MTDIVERLRSVDISWSQEAEWCAEAADEIEQLRRDKKLGLELMDVFIKQIIQLKQEIAHSAVYDEGPRLDARGDDLDGN